MSGNKNYVKREYSAKVVKFDIFLGNSHFYGSTLC